MSLREYEFKPTYRTDSDDIALDFLNPALSRGDQYDRAAGYFSSSSLRPLSRGMASFIARGGSMRLIMSPDLAEDDVDSITEGIASLSSTIERQLTITVEQLEADAASYPTRVLTWMIANRRLEVRIAIPVDLSAGIFHEKIGIVRDDSYTIAFTGSLNETEAAFERNFESIDVFCSWKEPARVANKVSAFERLWSNTTQRVSVVDFPSALRDRLIKIAPREMPIEAPPQSEAAYEVATSLRPYQIQAIEAWRANGNRGILEMATGTGKTVTAIEAVRTMSLEGFRIFLIVAPLKHLVDQWERSIRSTLDCDIVTCSSDTIWRATLPLLLKRLKLGNTILPLVILTTYATADSVDFQTIISETSFPIMLVADEMHNITAERGQTLFNERYTARLGLSATPERYMDNVGTEKSSRWFGGVVFKFGLKAAIDGGFLTPYEYYPIFCSLTESEKFLYDEILLEMNALESDEQTTASERQRRSGLLSQKRETLLEQAEDKLIKFEELIRLGSFQDDGYNLVYVHHELLDVVQLFLGREMHFTNHRFTARESVSERRDVLQAFSNKIYSFLIAIRCLDEGVDVPSTRTAFILKSSANPKEFVQRRGRILRRWPSKSEARIYDFVVLPGEVNSSRDEELLNRELDRFREFASLARNRQSALALLDAQKRKLGFGVNSNGP